VAPHAFDLTKSHPIQSFVVNDQQAIDSCVQFADDHRFIVEPACGAAIPHLNFLGRIF